MSEMHVLAVIQLPDDEFEEAAAKVALKQAYDAIHNILTEAKVTFTLKHETLRVKPQPKAKRGRKPKATSEPPAPGVASLFPATETEAAA